MQVMQAKDRQQPYAGKDLFAMLNMPANSPIMPPVNEVQVKAEIVLGPDLLSSLCRRGRRRLRDIQADYQVSICLDKARGVMHVIGSEASVAAARHHITTLDGPRKPVKAAVHAELLRTRMLVIGPEAALARIQEGSGCRIHIERSRQEVRLFGDSDAIAAAERLLEELDQQCGEEFVALRAGFTITALQLGALALLCGVALQHEENGLVVLGLTDSVKAAVERIDDYMRNPEKLLDLPMPEEPESHERVKTERSNDAVQKGVSVTANTCPTCGACPFCAACGSPTIFDRKGEGLEKSGIRTCATCGACPFCASCGNPTIFAHQVLTQAKVPMDKNTATKSPPYVGQQMPVMTADAGMAGGMAGGMVGGMAVNAIVGMVPGMVPTAYMMQHNGGLGMVPGMVSMA